jgi:hypothetical protein
MRLIDGDALIKRLDYCVSQGLGGNIAFMFGHMVDEAPTVDAVPVIRCKDCKWYYGDYCGGFGDGAFAPEDGFCHNAERKEE